MWICKKCLYFHYFNPFDFGDSYLILTAYMNNYNKNHMALCCHTSHISRGQLFLLYELIKLTTNPIPKHEELFIIVLCKSMSGLIIFLWKFMLSGCWNYLWVIWYLFTFHCTDTLACLLWKMNIQLDNINLYLWLQSSLSSIRLGLLTK